MEVAGEEAEEGQHRAARRRRSCPSLAIEPVPARDSVLERVRVSDAVLKVAMSVGRGTVVVGVLLLSFLVWLWRYSPEDEVGAWLEDNDLGHLGQHFRAKGLTTLQECASLDVASHTWEGLDEDSLLKLDSAVKRLDLETWLQGRGLGTVLPVLVREGCSSKEALHGMDPQRALQISQKLPRKEAQKFLAVLHDVREGRGGDSWEKEEGWTVGGVLWLLLKVTLVVLIIAALLAVVLYMVAVKVLEAVSEAITEIIAHVVFAVVVGVIYAIFQGIFSSVTGRRVQLQAPQSSRFSTLRPVRRKTSSNTGFSLGLYERIRGTYLDLDQSWVEWNHDDFVEVGGSSVITIHLIRKNSSPYDLQTSDCFHCTVLHPSTNSTIPHVVEPSPPTGHSTIRVSFTTRVTGKYSIDIKINGMKIRGSTITRNYLPGQVDASKTVFIDQTHVLVVTRGTYHAMTVIPKDSFGNMAIISQEYLTAEIRKDSTDGEVINPECVVDQLQRDCYELLLKVEEEGHYVGCVKYRGQRIGPPSFTIICLNDADAAVVEKNISRKSLNVWYEAHQTVDRGKTKKVYCYISPKQLQVREYFMRFIPTRVFTCKVCPATRVIFHAEQEKFTIDDGFQQPLTLSSPSRELLGATFYKFVLKNIGGSEKFQDKQMFFYNELKKHHNKQSRSEIRVNVTRFDLLNSAMHSTRNFSSSDWCKKFVVQFRGEEGLDWGGVSRECFELLSVECFDASKGLFKRFKDNPQALVHPNHQRSPQWKMKHFEFAGRLVGKCLYESAMGNPMLIKARFTRSFLAQLIGLRINHKYFEYDDPDLYVSKVQYIKENDVTDLGLVFAEEEFGPDGGNPKIVPLVEHGEEIEVTELNKLQYLNLLAQYRLAKCAKEEIDHFLKGLNEIVPDNLLSIFDENELELLMCGMGRVNFEDLKEHAVCSGGSPRFQLIVSWFWTIVSSFTQEEMARLLQFVTGCSQLPPGGFKELSPQFQIIAAPTHGMLPMAHTCFNQLCLPDYDTCEQFQSALMLAINEGAEGFGFL